MFTVLAGPTDGAAFMEIMGEVIIVYKKYYLLLLLLIILLLSLPVGRLLPFEINNYLLKGLNRRGIQV